jgi:DNA helicase-2/ATP-dependent DNA helicase PcrA
VDRGHEKRDNLEELRSTALEFQQMTPDESLTSFLEGVALVSDIDTLEDQQDAITLITLHQAKGLEFPVVFIVGLEEGLLPHFRSYDSTDQMEEERRLLYVGMTRAMDRLYLFKAMRRGFRGNGEPGRVFRPSQFLSDIPKQLITPLLETRNNADSSASLGFKRVELRDTVASVLPVEIGKKIRHARFGDGIVVSCLPSGEDYEVTVAFKGASGIKKLLLSYAHLDYID